MFCFHYRIQLFMKLNFKIKSFLGYIPYTIWFFIPLIYSPCFFPCGFAACMFLAIRTSESTRVSFFYVYLVYQWRDRLHVGQYITRILHILYDCNTEIMYNRKNPFSLKLTSSLKLFFFKTKTTLNSMSTQCVNQLLNCH